MKRFLIVAGMVQFVVLVPIMMVLDTRFNFWLDVYSKLGTLDNFKDNPASMIIFNISVIILGTCFFVYWYYFQDKNLNQGLIKKMRYLGIISSMAFIGIGFFPTDVLSIPHGISVFAWIFFLAINSIMDFYFNSRISPKIHGTLSFMASIIYIILLILYLITISPIIQKFVFYGIVVWYVIKSKNLQI